MVCCTCSPLPDSWRPVRRPIQSHTSDHGCCVSELQCVRLHPHIAVPFPHRAPAPVCASSAHPCLLSSAPAWASLPTDAELPASPGPAAAAAAVTHDAHMTDGGDAAAHDADDDDDDAASMTPSEVADAARERAERERLEALAAGRSARVAGRQNARAVQASTLAEITRTTGVSVDEYELLRAQQERERELEQSDLMGDAEQPQAEHMHDGAAQPAAARQRLHPHPVSKRGKKAAAAAAAAPSSRASPDDDIDAADLQYLVDSDTVSRTQHNKRMRAQIKEGIVKQERVLKAHLAQMAPSWAAKPDADSRAPRTTTQRRRMPRCSSS